MEFLRACFCALAPRDLKPMRFSRFRTWIRPYLPKKLRKLRHALYVLKNAQYNGEGLVTVHDVDFMSDPLFRESYRLGKATGSWGESDIPWRCYVACWAAKHAKALGGDFVECGVNRGALSRAVMHYIGFERMNDRKFYLLDTFRGFPDDLKKSAAGPNLQEYDECYEEVVRTFAEFENVVLIRGRIPESLPQVTSEKIAYLSIDMNVAEPEVAAAEFFWERMVCGGMIVLDDYGFGKPYWPQKSAMNEFARSRGVEVLLLPQGQGIICKP